MLKSYRDWILNRCEQIEDWQQSGNSRLFVTHGHNWDSSNNDLGCFLGYFIVHLLIFYEVQGYGDLLKDMLDIYERLKNTRNGYIETLFHFLDHWHERGPYYRKEHKIVIQAHTHTPYFEELTKEYEGHKRNEECIGMHTPNHIEVPVNF